MPTIKLSSMASRTLFPFGWRWRVRGEVSLEIGELSLIVDALVPQLLDAIEPDGGLVDVRGLPILPPELADMAPPRRGETLAIVEGKLHSSDAEEPPLHLTIGTEFLQRDGPHHIQHAVSFARSPTLSPAFPLRLLGRALPIQLRQIFLGFEFYRSECIIPMLGFSPTIVAGLTAHFTQTSLKIDAFANRLKRPTDLPLFHFPLAAAFLHAVNSVLHCSLEAEFQSQLDERFH